jgi:hypothetical protein
MKAWLNWSSNGYRNIVVNHKKRRLLHFYEKGKYQEMAGLFRNENDYVSVKFDEFPFLYYIVSNADSIQVRATRKQYLLC